MAKGSKKLMEAGVQEVVSQMQNSLMVMPNEEGGVEVGVGATNKVRQFKTVPDELDYSREFKPVKKLGGGVRETRPDGVYAYLVCPDGKLHCIRVDEGDAVIIVRRDGEFVDMVVKAKTNKAEALRAAARKFIKLINL